MANLVARLNAQPISTRFRIRRPCRSYRKRQESICPQARVELPDFLIAAEQSLQ